MRNRVRISDTMSITAYGEDIGDGDVEEQKLGTGVRGECWDSFGKALHQRSHRIQEEAVMIGYGLR